MKKVEVLISAMFQKDISIFLDTKIQSDALLINQCEESNYLEVEKDYGLLRCISTTERGLSRSRNMALSNAKGDYCLLCDDDEVLYEGYKEKIIEAYQQHPLADILCFQVKRKNKKYSNKYRRINYINSLKIASWQITFRLKNLQEANIMFDTNFGSGTSIGSGEENIFLYDCLKAGLRIYYIPECIGEVAQKESRWFDGFNEKYFINRGMVIKRMMGWSMGSLYCLYFTINKYPNYRNNMSWLKALKLIISGMKVKMV